MSKMITEILKNRFFHNMTRHPDLKWDLVEARLNENKEALEVLVNGKIRMYKKGKIKMYSFS